MDDVLRGTICGYNLIKESLMTPSDPVPPDAVGLRVEVSVADRDRLRVAAARAGKSMAAYVRGLIVERLDHLDAAEAGATPLRKRRGQGHPHRG